MLSQETIDTVKSTTSLLEENGEAITKYFYKCLFEQHPELKNVFNQVNQKRGDQPRALADAVLAYANNLDNIEALVPVVQRIAHKHVSLGIKPEQYPIVGQNLLAAIQHVLGLPDAHPALVAWEEAYCVLADIFINTEEGIYQENEEAEGGWRGFREFEIDKIVTETSEVKSFYLSQAMGKISPLTQVVNILV
jgi:nitric oxide dioxygenase